MFMPHDPELPDMKRDVDFHVPRHSAYHMPASIAAKFGMAFLSGSKASGIDELPYALELEPLYLEDASGKLKMRSLSGDNPPWKAITR